MTRFYHKFDAITINYDFRVTMRGRLLLLLTIQVIILQNFRIEANAEKQPEETPTEDELRVSN